MYRLFLFTSKAGDSWILSHTLQVNSLICLSGFWMYYDWKSNQSKNNGLKNDKQCRVFEKYAVYHVYLSKLFWLISLRHRCIYIYGIFTHIWLIFGYLIGIHRNIHEIYIFVLWIVWPMSFNCFSCLPLLGNDPILLIFFKWVETTHLGKKKQHHNNPQLHMSTLVRLGLKPQPTISQYGRPPKENLWRSVSCLLLLLPSDLASARLKVVKLRKRCLRKQDPQKHQMRRSCDKNNE